MRDDVREAVLDCVNYAVTKGTQSGRHIAPLAMKIAEDMERVGYDPDSIYLDDVNVTLPGWFRPSKKWDITAFEDGVLVAAIELKSINSSFGNNNTFPKVQPKMRKKSMPCSIASRHSSGSDVSRPQEEKHSLSRCQPLAPSSAFDDSRYPWPSTACRS